MVSPALDKDTIMADSGKMEAVDQPQKDPVQILIIVIFGSTNLNAVFS